MKIPSVLNAVLTALVIITLGSLLVFCTDLPLPWRIAAAVVFALIHFTAYCLLHEAEHDIAFESKRLNDAAGILLGLFFPAPFHLLRQGHLGHHRRNRTDTEAFDFYREHEKWMRRFQMYGTLFGIWWLVVAASPVFALLWPLPRFFVPADRAANALLDSFDPKSFPLIRAESFVVILFQGALLALTPSIAGYALFYACAGLLWSSLQYLHHYGTPRDVIHGAKNVRTFAWLDALWLNHNWHLNHHISPSTPWIHLPQAGAPRQTMRSAYFAMWKGPVPASDSVPDPTEGRYVE